MCNDTVNNILQDMWPRRHELTQKEWGQLFQVITQILNGCNDSRMKQLFGSKKAAITDFFTDKVFNPSRTPKDKRPASYYKLEHSNTLLSYFKNFLTDCARKQNNRDQHESHPEEDELNNFPDSAATACPEQYDDNEQNIADSAQAFLQQTAQEPRWEWVPTYLHWCFCTGQITAQNFAKAAEMPAYAYRLRRLGISLMRADIAWEGYENTLLGRWLNTTLGIDTRHQENIDEIHNVFKILCREAFLYVETQGNDQ
jgi:hypothetical protein